MTERKKQTAGAKPNARAIALDALLRVEQDGAFLDRVLPAMFERYDLSNEDRGLAMEIATGVLRRRRWLDRCLAPHAKGGLKKLDPIVLLILRIGAYQIVCLDRIPPHAAVSTSVDLAKHRRRFAAGLVNAVLRRVTEQKKPEDPTDSALAEYASVPEWLAGEVQRTLVGQSLDRQKEVFPANDSANARQILVALAEPAHPTLRVLENRLSRDQLAQQLTDRGANFVRCEYSQVGVSLMRAGEVSGLPGFGSGFIAQDEAAQLVCELARGEKSPSLDGCAAPGGKTIALASLGHSPITAVDVHEGRVQLLQRSLESAAVSGTVVQASMEAPPFSAESFATVLIDVPCTGSGTLKRHPELRWHLMPEDVERLATVQRSILKASAPLVKIGGCLIYAVCSFIPREGHEQIAAFLAEHHDFELESWLHTANRMHVMDGFFAAKLRRKR